MMKKAEVTTFSKKQLISKSNSVAMLSMAVAAFIVSFSLVSLNFLNDLSQHNDRVKDGKAEASKILKQNVENIPRIQASFNVLEAGDVKSSTILDALPSKYDYPALVTSMQSLAQRSGVSLEAFIGDDEEEIAIQSATQPEPIEIEFRISVSGSYVNLQEFIGNVERTIRPMKITRMEIKGQDTNINADMNITTYYQPATSLEVETRTME